MKTTPDRGPKPKKTRGVIFRRGHPWARWKCTEGHDHRWPAGSKTDAKDTYQEKARAARQARQRGEVCCPRVDKARKAAQPTAVLVNDLVADYATHSKRAKRSHATDTSRLPKVRAAFGHLLAEAVTPKLIEDWCATLQAEGRSPATCNRYLALLGAMFTRAVAHGRFAGPNPVARVRRAPEPLGRVRYLSAEEEAQLFAVLPAWLAPVVAFALLTGLRKEDILGLKWAMIDLPMASAHLPTTKTGPRTVLLHEAAVAILRAQRARSLVAAWCFPSVRGKRMQNVERAWRPALLAAALADFTFHDLKHTWASRLAMAGVGLYEIQKLGGWKSPAMVQRYAHLSGQHLRESLARLPVPGTDLQSGPAGGPFKGRPRRITRFES